MTGVFVAANECDKKMWKAFPDILSRQFRVKTFPPPQQPDGSHEADILISHPGHAGQLHFHQTIFVCKQSAGILRLPSVQDRSVAVVDSGGDRELLELVSATGLPAVTCGMSTKDTITLSSMETDSAVLTLQRSITCFDGSVAEPQEFPITLRQTADSFTLLAAAAVFILTGNAEALGHAQF